MLNDTNFSTYFSCTSGHQDYYAWKQQYKVSNSIITFQNWRTTAVFTCTAKTPYEFKNVSFYASLSPMDYIAKDYAGKTISFGRLTMPQSGELTRSEKTETLFIGYFSPPMSSTTVIYKSPSISSVTGSIRIPRADMLPTWQRQYDTAMDQLKSNGFLTAVPTLQSLADNQFKDAAEQLKAAREQQYQYAVDALKNGEFAVAVLQFQSLSQAGYKDSADLLPQAVEKDRAERYQQAEAAEKAGDYAKAESLFLALKSADYRDSKARYEQAREKRQAAEYKKAKDLMKKKDYSAALPIFQSLAKEQYKDSQGQAENAQCQIAIVNARAAIKTGDYTKAKEYLSPYVTNKTANSLYQLCRFRKASSVGRANAAGNVWVKYESSDTVQSMISSKGDVLAKDIPTAEISYYNDAGKKFVKKTYTSFETWGTEFGLGNRGGRYCVVDSKGKEIALSANAINCTIASASLICFQHAKTKLFGCMDLKGKVVIEAKYRYKFSFRNGFASVTDEKYKAYWISDKGKKMSAFSQYDFVYPLTKSVIAVGKKTSTSGIYKFGLIGPWGDEIKKVGSFVDNSYPYSSHYKKSGKNFILTNKNKMCITDLELNTVVGYKDYTISEIVKNKCYIAHTATVGYTLYSMKGKALTKVKYSYMYADETSGCIVAKNAADQCWYLLDLTGKVIY